LNLIDYIQDVVEFRHGEMTNFQVASCTLDASVKIYSYRVDSVHSETFKVMNGLSRSNAHSAIPEEDDENGDGKAGSGNDDDNDDGSNAGDNVDGNERGPVKKKRAHHQHTVNTIEQKIDNLNVKKLEREFEVDPLFRKTSASFDEGGARGLLLNHLYTHRGGQLLFDSKCAQLWLILSSMVGRPRHQVPKSSFQTKDRPLPRLHRQRLRQL
jgi:condensin complex subunit 2